MGIIVRPLSALTLANLGFAANFTDTFQRADSNSWGANWVGDDTFAGNAGTHIYYHISSNHGQAAADAVIGSKTGTALPTPLLPMGLVPHNHFSEITASSDSGATANVWGVGGSWNAFGSAGVIATDPAFGGGYCVNMRSNTTLQIGLDRFHYQKDGQYVSVNLIAQGTIGSYTFGDILRLETRYGVGVTNLTILLNGSSIATFADNTGLRFAQGSPALPFVFTAASYAVNYTRFSGGLLAS